MQLSYDEEGARPLAYFEYPKRNFFCGVERDARLVVDLRLASIMDTILGTTCLSLFINQRGADADLRNYVTCSHILDRGDATSERLTCWG